MHILARKIKYTRYCNQKSLPPWSRSISKLCKVGAQRAPVGVRVLRGYFQHSLCIILLSLSQSLHCMKQITDFSFCRPKHQLLKNCSHYESTSALYLYRKTSINQSIVWHPYCVQSTAGSSKVLKMPSTAIVSIPARLRLGALIPTLCASSSSLDCPILIFFNFFWWYKVVWSF